MKVSTFWPGDDSSFTVNFADILAVNFHCAPETGTTSTGVVEITAVVLVPVGRDRVAHRLEVMIFTPAHTRSRRPTTRTPATPSSRPRRPWAAPAG